MSVFKYVRKREISNRHLYLNIKEYNYIFLLELLSNYLHNQLRKVILQN